MSTFLRKFLLVFLMACIPLQGIAMQTGAFAHQGISDQAAPSHDEMGASHDCCPHDMPAPDQTTHSAAGDCSHCPLCGATLTPSVILHLGVNSVAALHPAPAPHLTRFYPEQPKRPPLARLS